MLTTYWNTMDSKKDSTFVVIVISKEEMLNFNNIFNNSMLKLLAIVPKTIRYCMTQNVISLGSYF